MSYVRYIKKAQLKVAKGGCQAKLKKGYRAPFDIYTLLERHLLYHHIIIILL